MSKSKLIEIIKEFMKWNPLRNDLDAYLYSLGQYAIGKEDKKPNPKDYGLE